MKKEIKITLTENDIHTAYNKLLVKYAALEKENAELKNNLTKAKELLKEFVHHYKAKTIYIENMQDLLEQAEQFISEVEK